MKTTPLLFSVFCLFSLSLFCAPVFILHPDIPRPALDGNHFWTRELRAWSLNVTPSEYWIPRGIAINGTGHAFVLLANNSGGGSGYVQVYSPQGIFLYQWGGKGTGFGQFAEPGGIAINSSGAVYVADARNHRVQVFSPSGGFQFSFGSFGFEDGQFIQPYGIAMNSTGQVFVTDGSNWRVQVFSPSGSFLYKWEGRGTGPGLFESPYAITINDTDHVFVLDMGNENFQVFNPDGQYVYSSNYTPGFELPFILSPAILHRTGHMLLAEEFPSRAVLCSTFGTLLFSFKPFYSSPDSQFPGLVEALAVDQGDLVYTTGFVDYKVHVFSPPYAPQAPLVHGPWWGLDLDGRVDLGWAACGGAVTYRVYRATAPITTINDTVIYLGETAGTTWADDRNPGEYYYAVGAVNEFTETLSAPSRVLVVALIPGIPPLAGLVIVLSGIGAALTAILFKTRQCRTIRNGIPLWVSRRMPLPLTRRSSLTPRSQSTPSRVRPSWCS